MSLVVIERVIPRRLRRREQGIFLLQSKPESEKHAKTMNMRIRKRERDMKVATKYWCWNLNQLPFCHTLRFGKDSSSENESSLEKTVTIQDCFSH